MSKNGLLERAHPLGVFDDRVQLVVGKRATLTTDVRSILPRLEDVASARHRALPFSMSEYLLVIRLTRIVRMPRRSSVNGGAHHLLHDVLLDVGKTVPYFLNRCIFGMLHD